MALNMTTADAMLKELYVGQRVVDLTYQGHPLLALLPKFEKFVGRNMPLPISYANPQNRSATFSTASALTDSTDYEQWALTRVKNYNLAFVDGETMHAADGDKGSFVDALTREVDGAMKALSDDIAFSICRDSSGYKAQVNAEPSEASTTVITLKEPHDVVGFERGMSIEVYSAKSGGSQRTYDGTVTSGLITAITRDSSSATITVNTTYDSSGTIAADDFIFVAGDRGVKVTGLEDWVPDSAPTTSLFGVDRTEDTTRLGGVRSTGTGKPIEEALIDLAFDINREGGRPDYAFMNQNQMRKLVKQLQSRVSYVDLQVTPRVGFQGVEIVTGDGVMTVLADRNIRDSRAYALQMDTWKLCSIGPLVKLLDTDGRLLRQSSADAYEVRVGSYYQLGCHAPGHNGVVTLD